MSFWMNNHYRSFSESPRSARDIFSLTPSRDRKSFTTLILAFGKFHNGLIMTLRSAGFKHFLSSNAHWHIYYTTIKLIKSFMLLEKKKRSQILTKIMLIFWSPLIKFYCLIFRFYFISLQKLVCLRWHLRPLYLLQPRNLSKPLFSLLLLLTTVNAIMLI